MNRLWSSLPFASRLHVCLAGFWALMYLPTVPWWNESILWIGTISIYAIVVGHWSAAEASRPTDKAAS